MIEREFVKEKIKEFQIQEFVASKLSGAGHSHTQLKRTPLGDKIIISASRPGLVVGRKGENIRDLTEALRKKFKLENPQLEISEIENPFLDAQVIAESITTSLERFGTSRFKRIGYSTLEAVMNAGALGVEILMSGKIPGARARTWRFWQGYMKKSGSVSQSQINRAIKQANLKTGVIGIVVRVLTKDVKLPDAIKVIGEEETELQKRVEAAKSAGVRAGGVEEEESIDKAEVVPSEKDGDYTEGAKLELVAENEDPKSKFKQDGETEDEI